MHIKIFEGTDPYKEHTNLVSSKQLNFLLGGEYAQAKVNLEKNFEKIIPEMEKKQYALAQEYINRSQKHNGIIKKVLPCLDKSAILNELTITLEELWS